MMTLGLHQEAIDIFCRRWKIAELSVFGSALRDDFGPQSDIDVMVTFAKESSYGIWDHFAMQEELAGIFGRKVDLLTRHSVEMSDNWIRRREILGSAVPVYATR